MMYPLVRELAEDGIPVSVTCRVLKIARQPDAELVEAYRANALFDAYDDPEFGYRFLVDEARDAGQAMAERTAWRICSANGWWSVFGKPKKGKAKKPGPPVHDDLCAFVDTHGVTRHEFNAEGPNQLWVGDITEHWTAWIPAVVATLAARSEDAGKEVHGGAAVSVHGVDRPRRFGEGRRGVGGCAPGSGVPVDEAGGTVDAKEHAAHVHPRGEGGVLPPACCQPERLRGGPRAGVQPSDLLRVGAQGGDLHR
jgi:hypothetical protein